MMPIDVQALVEQTTRAVSTQIGKDVMTLTGFSRDQVEGLARQAQLIAAAFASGHLSQDDRSFFLDDLKQTTRDFVNTLAGLAAVEVEKAWNAAVTALWSAIGTAAKIVLPSPF
jgi:hypothetical protein